MASFMRLMGNLLILGGLAIFILIYAPLVVQEITFRVRPENYYELADGPRNEILNINPEKILTPVDLESGIVIPKINANAAVVRDVDPNNQAEYQLALSRGVAHALGSDLPNQSGNVFLFSHSAANFWEASRFNSIFYLLNKLEPDDQIFLYYKTKKYSFEVIKKTMVGPEEVSFASKDYAQNSLVLMTCWPPGTTYKRVIVEAKKLTDK